MSYLCYHNTKAGGVEPWYIGEVSYVETIKVSHAPVVWEEKYH